MVWKKELPKRSHSLITEGRRSEFCKIESLGMNTVDLQTGSELVRCI
jgi:hypothetical protein